ncbi:site-specific integrase [Rhodoferax sp.]|uniref:site-specific integrase n=1 Tax=Rhodoferax sp. TaxID=50421 RepID=UPI002731A0ED|nr:site-specific integrase [Rhodoferax sp.]MDP2441057.1 site-specific integrase [Rhodoferax sp.]
MEASYERADAYVRTIGGTSAEHLSSFLTWLGSQQYSVGYACIVARHALAFCRWFEARGIKVSALTDGEIGRYQRSLARRRTRRPDTRRQERQALNLLLLFLREQGLCAAVGPCANAVDRVCAVLTQHLQCNQALAAATVDIYTRVARQFLVWRFGQAEVCLCDLRPSDAIAFVRHESMRMAPPAVKTAANALRSFLRFGEFRGEVPAGLSAGVPSVATWTTTPPMPKAISAEHAQRAIDGCDCMTATGRRDRAVLLLLARLGLRACEIIRLTLDDIDWDQSRLRIRGKGGRQSLLPLPADVGAAIAAYLQDGRPTCEDRRIFLRSMAPIRALLEGSDGVGSIVRYALARAQVDAPHRGSHQFRHALAAQMLRQGASLPEIAQVLRHRSPQTTSIYAKVDLESLRTLVVAWPGSTQ